MTDASVAAAIVTAALLATCWLILGWWLLKSVRDALLPSERLALALLAGAGVMGVAIFVIGQVRFSTAVVVGLALLSLLPLADGIERRALLSTLREIRRPSATVLVPLVALFAMLLLIDLARPVGSYDSDAISYHLLGPTIWLRLHQIVPALDSSHTAFPVAIEALFGAGMAIGNERAPGAIGVVLVFAVVVQVYGLSRWLGARARWASIATVLVAFMPLVTRLGVGWVDVEYAGFALAGFRLLFTPGTQASLAGPMFLGLSMATKYNGMTLTAVTLAISALRQGLDTGFAASLSKTARAAFFSALFALPFLLRNVYVFGTPVYPPPPLLARLLPARGFSMEAAIRFQHYIVDERGIGLGRGWTDFFLLPWRFTLHSANFNGAGGIGLAALAFFPAAVVTVGVRKLRWILAWLVGNTLVWFVVQQEARFLAPFFIMATAVAMIGAEAVEMRFSLLGRAVTALVVGVSILYGAGTIARSSRAEVKSVFSRRADTLRWAAEVPYWQAFAYLNALPEPCRVLMLQATAPPYYLHKDYVKVEGGYYEHPVPGIEDPTTALAHLGQLGVTHVLDVEGPKSRGDVLRIPLPAPSPLELVFNSPSARVFRVRPESTSLPSR